MKTKTKPRKSFKHPNLKKKRLRDMTVFNRDTADFVSFPAGPPAFSVACVEAYFDDLANVLCREIEKHDVVVGCVAWLNDEKILKALSRKQVSFVVNKEDWLRPDENRRNNGKKLRASYDLLKNDLSRHWLPEPLPSMSYCAGEELEPVRCAGRLNGAHSLRCHHKFAVFGHQREDRSIEPIAVWTGSFNWTAASGKSLENAIIIRDSRIAEAYLKEWANALAISETLDWKHKHVEPTWRLGS